MLKPIQDAVQTYVARSYLQFRTLRPAEDEGYWRNGAIADTALVLFLGPLSSWIPAAIFSGHFGPNRKVLLGVCFAATCVIAVYLSFRAARSSIWKAIVVSELQTPPTDDRLWMVRSCALLLWTVGNPLLWAVVYDARLV